ncbi:PAP27 [Scenedesmus sp. PABB004]|nr:PAP27 [Scenedesmus sp. PABB004]
MAQLAPGCTPTQVHLAFGRDASEMHVSWKTAAANCPSELMFRQASAGGGGTGVLRRGDPGVMNAVGYSFLLSERDMCSGPAAANAFMLNLHRVKLSNLVGSTDYLYQVAGSEAPLRFTSGAPPSRLAGLRFVAFGDMGDARHVEAKSPGASATLLRLKQELSGPASPPSLVLHLGDIAYANGAPELWDSFMDDVSPLAARLPWMVAVGNHEYGYSRPPPGASIDPSGASRPYQPKPWGNFGDDSHGECGAMLARRFHMPNPAPRVPGGPRANAPFWYSFAQGPARFVVLSTEHSLEPGSVQYGWLEAELAAVDRCGAAMPRRGARALGARAGRGGGGGGGAARGAERAARAVRRCATPWVVVGLHRPLYVVYPHKSNRDVADHLRASLEPLLTAAAVDLTISGHVHSYYRTCAVAGEECTADSGDEYDEYGRARGDARGRGGGGSGHGIVHFVVGSAGRKLSDVERGQEAWLAASVQQWGFLRLTARAGGDSLLAEFVGSEDGEVLDSVEVVPSVQARGARDDACARAAVPAAS